MSKQARQGSQFFVFVLLVTLSSWFVEVLVANHTNCAILATGTCEVDNAATVEVFYEFVYTPHVLKLSYNSKGCGDRKNFNRIFQTLESAVVCFRHHTERSIIYVHQNIWLSLGTVHKLVFMEGAAAKTATSVIYVQVGKPSPNVASKLPTSTTNSISTWVGLPSMKHSRSASISSKEHPVFPKPHTGQQSVRIPVTPHSRRGREVLARFSEASLLRKGPIKDRAAADHVRSSSMSWNTGSILNTNSTVVASPVFPKPCFRNRLRLCNCGNEKMSSNWLWVLSKL
uniref:Placenta-expressed transcript 1 protein n=1 Tax=Panagrellus redivivus TaxID=6233 RepID=A0A7E4USQ4_PANRE